MNGAQFIMLPCQVSLLTKHRLIMPGTHPQAIRYWGNDIYQRAVHVWKNEGPASFLRLSARKLLHVFWRRNSANPQIRYEIEALLKNPFFDFSKIELQSKLQPYPVVSIVVPIYNGVSFVPD
jgi:hypothetical protein